MVMDLLISVSQSAFIQGRQMNDCILITSEVYSSIKGHKSESLILKTNFEKAFDSVKWEFLFEVLSQMNFDENWIIR